MSFQEDLPGIGSGDAAYAFHYLCAKASYGEAFYASLSRKQEQAEAKEFYGYISTMLEQDFITAIRIYLPENPENVTGSYDFPDTVAFCDSITGSYWHGIFNGSPQTSSLYCPSFYLTDAEIDNLGSLAYICKLNNVVSPEGEFCYIVIYFSADYLQKILLENLTKNSGMYYLINSRNSIVNSSDQRLAGTYFMRYEKIPSVIGSRQEFSTVKILEGNLYMGYRDIGPTGGWCIIIILWWTGSIS